MKPINTEVRLNHSTGISDSYYRATENELLQDYLKAVTLLNINEDTMALRKQVLELNEKSKDTDYIVKAKLTEKDEIINSMREKYDTEIIALKEAIINMQNFLRHPNKLKEISV